MIKIMIIFSLISKNTKDEAVYYDCLFLTQSPCYIHQYWFIASCLVALVTWAAGVGSVGCELVRCLSFPHSGGRQVACGLEPEELLLGPRALGQHADESGQRPAWHICALGALPEGAKVLNLFHIHFYFTASGNARPLPPVTRPPLSVNGRSVHVCYSVP